MQSYTGNIYKIRSGPTLPDTKYLSRVCPRKITTDKEKLYEENINLKQMYNFVNDENLKLRTRILQLEKTSDQFRQVEILSSPSMRGLHLVDGLKQNIKDLKTEIKAKDKEIEETKRHMRFTKIQELESDLLQYSNECLRLKRIIDELLVEKNIWPQGNEKQENREILKELEVLRKMNKEKEQWHNSMFVLTFFL